eukprot:4336437-Amphidinium_carterae.1
MLSRGTVPVTLQTVQRVSAPDRAAVFRVLASPKVSCSVLLPSLVVTCVIQCLVVGAHCHAHVTV